MGGRMLFVWSVYLVCLTLTVGQQMCTKDSILPVRKVLHACNREDYTKLQLDETYHFISSNATACSCLIRLARGHTLHHYDKSCFKFVCQPNRICRNSGDIWLVYKESCAEEVSCGSTTFTIKGSSYSKYGRGRSSSTITCGMEPLTWSWPFGPNSGVGCPAKGDSSTLKLQCYPSGNPSQYSDPSYGTTRFSLDSTLYQGPYHLLSPYQTLSHDGQRCGCILNVSHDATIEIHVEGDCIQIQCTVTMSHDTSEQVYVINGPAIVTVGYNQDVSCDGCDNTYFLSAGSESASISYRCDMDVIMNVIEVSHQLTSIDMSTTGKMSTDVISSSLSLQSEFVVDTATAISSVSQGQGYVTTDGMTTGGMTTSGMTVGDMTADGVTTAMKPVDRLTTGIMSTDEITSQMTSPPTITTMNSSTFLPNATATSLIKTKDASQRVSLSDYVTETSQANEWIDNKNYLSSSALTTSTTTLSYQRTDLVSESERSDVTSGNFQQVTYIFTSRRKVKFTDVLTDATTSETAVFSTSGQVAETVSPLELFMSNDLVTAAVDSDVLASSTKKVSEKDIKMLGLGIAIGFALFVVLVIGILIGQTWRKWCRCREAVPDVNSPKPVELLPSKGLNPLTSNNSPTTSSPSEDGSSDHYMYIDFNEIMLDNDKAEKDISAQDLDNPTYDKTNIGHTYDILDPKYTGVFSNNIMPTNSGCSLGAGDPEVDMTSIYLEPSVNAALQPSLLCRDSGISSNLSDVTFPIDSVSSDITAAKQHVYLLLKDDIEHPLKESSRIPDIPVYDFIPEDIINDSGAFLSDAAAIKTSTAKNCMPDVVQGSVSSPVAKQ